MYNLTALSDADFEDLTRDLLQAELNILLEAFASGRDFGIDLRYSSQSVLGRPLIVQCKHYERSGFPKLREHIRRRELPKVRILNPERYILCTSASLTPGNKDKLLEILSPFCQSPADILGKEDIFNLLERHPQVGIRHHKLWLTSVPILQLVLNSDLFIQTGLERRAIERDLFLYVQTPAYDEARKLLEKYNYCIISGIPGIGKTTLARILLISLMELGFDLVVVRQNIREAFASMVDPSARLAIYYDDFLGSSSFGEALEKNEDQNIIRLLVEAGSNSARKIIFTTREYILNQARQRYERLDRDELQIAKCIVDLRVYTRSNRARILYNHLYFSDLPRSFLASILKGGCYKEIIDHPNYSPRIIEWMTGAMALRDLQPGSYGREFLRSLDHPERIWSHAFENQISAEARQILLLLATLPSPVSVELLSRCFSSLTLQGSQGPAYEIGSQFRRALRELDGSFVAMEKANVGMLIEFHNPSIQDFILERLAHDVGACELLLSRAIFFEQADRLASLSEDGKVRGRGAPVVMREDLLGKVVTALLGSPSGSLRYLYYGSDGLERYIPKEVSVAERISRVGEWAASRHSILLGELISRLTEDLVIGNRLGEEEPENLLGLVKALCLSPRSDSAETIRVDPLLGYLEAALASYPDAETWLDCSSLLSEIKDYVEPERVASFRSLLCGFCEEESRRIDRDAEFYDDVESGIDTLEALGRPWGVNVDHLVSWLRKRNYDLPERKSEHDTQVREGGITSNGETDTEIDALFDSLRYLNR